MAKAKGEWVAERTLSAAKGRFAWRLDEAGNLAIRWREGTRVIAREELERIGDFMADGEWHPASRVTEAAFGGRTARSIEGFLREELGWTKRDGELGAHVGAVLVGPRLWEWNERTRGVMFCQRERSRERLRAHYEACRKGAPRPRPRSARGGTLRRRSRGPQFDLAAAFRGLSKGLRARFETCDAGRHPLEKGQRREAAVREFLRDHLPARYGVTRGEVVAATGEASRQTDVLLYDALQAPSLLATDTSMILAAESVYAAIEIKPRLGVRELEAAVVDIASVKALPRSAILRPGLLSGRGPGPRANPPVFGAVFAFEAQPPARLLEALHRRHEALPPALWVDCVCVLDRAVIYRLGAVPGPAGWTPEASAFRTPLACVEAGGASLLFFTLLLLQDLNAKKLLPPDLLFYSQALRLPKPLVR